MAPIDYKALLEQAFSDYSKLLHDRQQLDLELNQKEQFIRATMNMLPEREQAIWRSLLELMSTAENSGLTERIRATLRTAPRNFYTATEVKKMLVEAGFNFSKYEANPLSSVHAALKRLKPEEAEMSHIDGVMAWRWVSRVDSDLARELNTLRRRLHEASSKEFLEDAKRRRAERLAKLKETSPPPIGEPKYPRRDN